MIAISPTTGPVETLVIGCGNLLRGDDAAGPVFVRRLWDLGLPEGVRCCDGGTGGMDVAFQMRGVPRVVLVDACSSGSEPGAIFCVPGPEVEHYLLCGASTCMRSDGITRWRLLAGC